MQPKTSSRISQLLTQKRSGPQSHSRQPRRKRTFPSRPFRTFDEGPARREPSNCGSPPGCGIWGTTFTRPSRKIFRVAAILNYGRGPNGKAARSSHKIWISRDRRRFTPVTDHGVVLVRLQAPSRMRFNQRWKCFRLKRSASGRGLLSSSPIKNPGATEAKPILKLRPGNAYCPALTGETIRGLAVRFLASPLSC